MILTLSACTTVKEHSNTFKTAKIMDKENAQIALTLNKNLELNILSIRDGKIIDTFEPCGKKTGCRDYQNNNDISSEKRKNSDIIQAESDLGKAIITQAGIDPKKVFFQKTITVTLVKGSCCATISGGDETEEFCTPDYTLEFIRDELEEQCL